MKTRPGFHLHWLEDDVDSWKPLSFGFGVDIACANLQYHARAPWELYSPAQHLELSSVILDSWWSSTLTKICKSVWHSIVLVMGHHRPWLQALVIEVDLPVYGWQVQLTCVLVPGDSNSQRGFSSHAGLWILNLERAAKHGPCSLQVCWTFATSDMIVMMMMVSASWIC